MGFDSFPALELKADKHWVERNIDRAFRLIQDPDSFVGRGRDKETGEWVFVVRLSKTSGVTKPETIAGVRVIYEEMGGAAVGLLDDGGERDDRSGRGEWDGDRKALRIGSAICRYKDGSPDEMELDTLGCFVEMESGEIGILSTSHFPAKENLALEGIDQFASRLSSEPIATLHSFIPLSFGTRESLAGNQGTVPNEVDAAVAVLAHGVPYLPNYDPTHKKPELESEGMAEPGDRVFKVGHATGLTYGTVSGVSGVIGPIQFKTGSCWFRETIEIEGEDGTVFADKGDGGAVVVRERDGAAVGLIYAGNKAQTYACPMDRVLKLLGCKLLRRDRLLHTG